MDKQKYKQFRKINQVNIAFYIAVIIGKTIQIAHLLISECIMNRNAHLPQMVWRMTGIDIVLVCILMIQLYRSMQLKKILEHTDEDEEKKRK